MKNKFLKGILDLITSSGDVSIEEMQAYLAELKKTKGIEHLNLVQFDIVEVKAQSGGLRIKAVASTPSIDRGNDIVVPEGITTPNLKGATLPMLHQHDADQQIGVWEKWGVVEGKFVMEGVVFAPITEWQKDVYSRIESKALNGISIGFIGLEVSMLADEVRQFDKIELLEVSVVTIPMNQDCFITEVTKDGEAPAEGSQAEAPAEEATPKAGPTTVKSEGEPDATVPEGSNPDTATPSPQPTPNEQESLMALKDEEIAKLKIRVSELEAEVSESDSLLEVIVEQNEQLLKSKGVK